MPNRPRTNLDSHSAHQAVYQTEILSDSKVLHQDIKDAQTTTNNKLDSLSGAINNSSIGDASIRLQTYCYGHDSINGQARALKVDSTGRLECNVADIELHTGDIALSVDGLEALIGTTNTKLQSDLDFAGQPNSIGDGSNMKRVMNYGHDSSNGQQRPLKIDGDGHLQVDCLSSALPTGGATEAKQDVIEATLTNIETSSQLIDDTVTAQSAAHPSKAFAVGGRYYADNTFRDIRVDNIGKVIIDTPTGSDLDTRLATLGTNTTGLNNCVSGNELQVDVVSMPTTTISGTVTANLSATDNAVLDAIALDGDNIQTKLDTLEASLTSMESKQDAQETTLNAIQTAVEIIDNCISGNEAQVDVISMPTTTITGTVTANLSTTDNNVLDAIAVDGDNIQTKLDTLEASLTSMESKQDAQETTLNAIQTAVEGTLTVGSHNVTNGGTFATQATIQNSSIAVSGTVTANLSATDNAVLDSILAKNTQLEALLTTIDADTSHIKTNTQSVEDCINNDILSVGTKKSYTSETSIISGQTVTGSGTHTTSSIANDANNIEFIVEHNFSGSDVSYEIFESIDNSNFFNAMGMTFNESGDPSAGLTGINVIQIKSPHFKVKFTNGNGSSRDVTLSYVAIKN